MKAVLLSVRPQRCEKICHQIGRENGTPIYEKSLEIRKNRPKLDTPFKCYIYRTKEKMRLLEIMRDGDENYGEIYHGKPVFIKTYGNHHCSESDGKVIGEFVCDRIDMLAPINHCDLDVEGASRLSREQIVKYLKGHGYGWHISDLKIYGKPKELNEFYHYLPDKILDDGDYDCRGGGKIMCMDMPEGGDDCAECPYGGRVYLKHAPQSWCYVEEVKQDD